MNDFLTNNFDLVSRYAETAGVSANSYTTSRREENTASNELSFTDMLELMVVQFQNQSIDNQASTADMMNQLVQMTVMQAMTSMTEQMEQLSTLNTMTYSASLVGKEVTVGVYNDVGELQEIVGTVTASGTYDGQPVIFLGNESYLLSSVMAVGRLPQSVTPDALPGGSTTPDNSGSTDVPPVENVQPDTTVDSGDMDDAVDNSDSENSIAEWSLSRS